MSQDTIDPQTPSHTARSVLVTGGSKGIGRAIAADLAAAGHKVAATYRSGDVPDGVLGVQCDITDPEQVEAAFKAVEEAHGPVEILVANAGITKDGLLMRMSDADFEQVIDTNLTGTFRVVRRAVRPMMKARHGRIVLISSVVALLGSAGQVNYASSKAALVGMSRSVARELGGRGITCNVVAPGFIETDMTAVLSDDLIESYKKSIPVGRLGSTDDIAAAVRYLTSDAAGYVTGAVVPIDGGLGMGH
ncbi:3-oxoacyl-[acyl-carrier-protein] reductase [Luteococcus japonicus]|uniref:3-oxoacyl-[acyl-carrier protein] reductase n=2 Tax=Luteococcus japonicus TaxID=33984 RepID=A0A1R4K8S8_9ACTN|nr:beta-ketoacyl-ACP reductase [Luteococcus japonicus]MDN5563937.1 beta-ketoacyl-ACP reductase [Luteococcus sp.]ROR55681.1 3-oxoacyl-[acyl-carrier-protein] reductase [Luteococcus japonicus]SJN40522.1 3-oxoacyl-[acyl-carrier protein] reductase [Luteococcus japonicus LSP_Lj1]